MRLASSFCARPALRRAARMRLAVSISSISFNRTMRVTRRFLIPGKLFIRIRQSCQRQSHGLSWANIIRTQSNGLASCPRCGHPQGSNKPNLFGCCNNSRRALPSIRAMSNNDDRPANDSRNCSSIGRMEQALTYKPAPV